MQLVKTVNSVRSFIIFIHHHLLFLYLGVLWMKTKYLKFISNIYFLHQLTKSALLKLVSLC